MRTHSAAPRRPVAGFAAGRPASDDDLIALCQQAVVAFQEARAISAAGTQMLGAAFDQNWALANAKADLASGLAECIAMTPANTMAGIRARVSAIQEAMPIDYGIGDTIPFDWHHGMLDALFRDLKGSAGA